MIKMDKLDLILEKLDAMQKDIDELKAMKESLDEVREGVNTLLDWADNVAIEVKIPLKPAQSVHRHSQTVPDIRCRLFYFARRSTA